MCLIKLVYTFSQIVYFFFIQITWHLLYVDKACCGMNSIGKLFAHGTTVN